MATATDNLESLLGILPKYDPFLQAGNFVWREDRASAAVEFVERHLIFTHGPRGGEPFQLEDWQRALLANLYGWWNKRGTERRYRHMLLMLGRGNGKSELAAAIVCLELYAMKSDPGAQLYGVAAKQDQTRFIFDPVCRMIRANPTLMRPADIYKRSLTVGDRAYRAICHTAGTEIGGAVQFAVADEVHAHLDRSVLDMLETGMLKRRNPLLVSVSTSDYEREGSPLNQMHDYAVKVRDGIIDDPTLLPAIFEATRDDDWTDPAVWRLANPNLDVAIREEDLRLLCNKAQNDPTFENEFKRLHLNIRSEQAVRLLPVERWDACEGELPDLLHRDCWCGLDLGATRDFTAFVAAFPLSDGRLALKVIFWIPEWSAQQRRNKMGATFRAWERAGALRITPGNEVDYDRVEADVAEFASLYSVREIAADRLFQGAQIIQRLNEKHGIEVIEHGQGFLGMAVPTRTFLEYVGSRRVLHGGNPVMRWMISNLTGKQDEAGNWKPDKKRSGEKIDGAVAAIMGVGRAVAAGNTRDSIGIVML